MKKIRSTLILPVGLILLAGLLTPAAAHEGLEKAGQTQTLAAPPLGDFIDIWIDDTDNFFPAVAYNDRHDEYLVVWENDRAMTRDIYARRIDGDGNVLDSLIIVHKANAWYQESAVAYSSVQDEYLVVYTLANDASTGSDIWARRVAWDGSWLGIEFEIGRKADEQYAPAVVYNRDADEYLVVYQNLIAGSLEDIDAARVQAGADTSLGWQNIATAPGEKRSQPDVAWNPASNYYLIAYEFQTTGVVERDIYAKGASWNLGYLSDEIHICDDDHDQSNVTVTASSHEFLALWEDELDMLTTEIYARRLAADGTPLGSGGGFWVSGANDRHDVLPDVAYTGGGYLAAWTRHSGGAFDVYARYLVPGRDSAVGEEFALDNNVANQVNAVVACAGSGRCLMAEEDNNSAGGDTEIRGRLVTFRHVCLPQVLKNVP